MRYVKRLKKTTGNRCTGYTKTTSGTLTTTTSVRNAARASVTRTTLSSAHGNSTSGTTTRYTR
ncbi:hypothetical protein DPMN_080161 [Dreissena polymorpha]|uniref:Uncharacterized protein n=1 Tax=Dreissena polymorpha TaxID=45954 RepID=A0A9D3YS43_DREPO|nr:hypothetical protein DPMN_080161 [Dreissena polymorpha]